MLKKKLKTKISTILIVFCVVLVYLIPHILGYLTLKNYFPCNAYVATDDCVWYPARYRDFYDGNYFVEDHLIFENKNINITALPFTDPIIYGLFYFLLLPFISINLALIIIKMLFVTVNFLLLKRLGEKIFKDKMYSLFFALIIVTNLIWKNFVLIVFYVLKIISENFANYLLSFIGRSIDNIVFLTPLLFDRAPRPNLTFIFLTLSTIFLLNILENKKIKKTTLILYGLVWSALFYIYLFYFVSFFISVSLLLPIFFLKNKQVFKKLILVSTFAIIFSIPYWINYFNFKRSKFYSDFILRLGVEQGHFVRVLSDYSIWFVILLIFILMKNKIKIEWFYFCLTFFLGAFMGLNIQLITGFNPHPDHFVTKVIKYIMSYMILTILYVGINSLKRKYQKAIISILILVIFMLAVLWQIQFFESRKQALSLSNEEIEVYDWLEKQKKTYSILSDELIMNYNIPFYTKHDIFFPQGVFTILTNKEIIDRTFKTYSILNYSEEEMRSKLNNLWEQKYKTKKEKIENVEDRLSNILVYIELLGLKKRKKSFIMEGFVEMNETLNKEDIDKFIESYKEIKNAETIKLDEKADYIVTKRNLHNRTPFKNLEIKEVFRNGEYFIYKLNKLY